MAKILALILLIPITACGPRQKVLTNKEIITLVKECKDAGLAAGEIDNLGGQIVMIQCHQTIYH